MDKHVVVWDPLGEFWEGALLEQERAQQLAARGVISLPVEPDLFMRSGIGGYMKRAWGAGWSLNVTTPRMACPLTLWVEPGLTSLHWAARIIRDARLPEIETYGGSLRLVSDSGQPGVQIGGFIGGESTAVDLAKETQGEELPADLGGGWVIRGTSRLNAAGGGYVALALYGSSPGLRVAWAAVSLSA